MAQVLTEKWRKWALTTTNGRIFAGIVTLVSFSLIVRLLNAGKEMYLAAQFGTGDQMDAFLFAYTFPAFGVGTAATAFNIAFLPTFVQVREQQGHGAAQRLFSSATIASFALLFVVAVLMAVVLPPLIPHLATGFSAEKILLTNKLLLILLPIIVLSGTSSIWSGALNAGEKFMLPALAPVMRPIGIILFVLIFSAKIGISAIVFGLCCGHVAELVILAIALRRQGISILPRWCKITPELKFVFGQYVPLVAGCLILNGSDLVDRTMAAMLLPGSVATLSYGSKLVEILLALVISSVGTAVMPHFSKMVALKDWVGLKKTYKTYATVLFACSIPIVLIFSFFSEQIVALFYQRGAVTAKDVLVIAQVQKMSALQIPFYVLVVMTARVVTALKEAKLQTLTAILTFILNAVFNYICMKWLGVAGIALSTALTYAVGYFFMYCLMVYLLKQKERLEPGHSF